MPPVVDAVDPEDTSGPPDRHSADAQPVTSDGEETGNEGDATAIQAPASRVPAQDFETQHPTTEKSAALQELPDNLRSLLGGLVRQLNGADLTQFSVAFSLYQSELEARASRQAANREFELQAELNRTRLDLEKQRTRAELDRTKAELDHLQSIRQIEARRANWGDRIRSVVLLLVVLAVVITPILAMGVGNMSAVPPESFSQYVAPVTAIAGTILGYWFGRSTDKKE